MVDNFYANEGSTTTGKRFRTKDIGSLHHNVMLLEPTVSGGCEPYVNIDMGISGSTGVNVKATAGQVYGWAITNSSTSVRYVKLYNKATAPDVTTDVPRTVIELKASGGSNISISMGVDFPLGIGIVGVTGPAHTNSTAPGANEVIVNLFYK